MSVVLAAITIMGSGRLGPTITALLGLSAAVLGAGAYSRRKRAAEPTLSGQARHRHSPLLLGLAAVVLGGIFLAAADGGPGTGDGVVGSVAAIILGCVAVVIDLLPGATKRSDAAVR